MAKLKEGVYERILDCAKVEFLEKGFKDASLRVIAKNANTSTSSIYSRFQDKEGLFDAIVDPIKKEFLRLFKECQEVFQTIDPNKQDEVVYEYSKGCYKGLIDYIYDHFDGFQLLLTGAYGTKSSDFIEQLVEIEVDYTYKFILSTQNDAVVKGRANRMFLHIITKAYFSGFFEIVLHDMKREEADAYINQLRIFYSAGHMTIYHPEKFEF